MNVQELMDKLKTFPPTAQVKTWDCFTDCQTDEVYITILRDGEAFIGDFRLGEDIQEPTK